MNRSFATVCMLFVATSLSTSPSWAAGPKAQKIERKIAGNSLWQLCKPSKRLKPNDSGFWPVVSTYQHNDGHDSSGQPKVTTNLYIIFGGYLLTGEFDALMSSGTIVAKSATGTSHFFEGTVSFNVSGNLVRMTGNFNDGSGAQNPMSFDDSFKCETLKD